MEVTIQTDQETDQLYIGVSKRAFRKGTASRTVQLDEDIALDFDKDGRLVGIDVLNASARIGRNWSDVSLDQLVGVTEAAKVLAVRPQNFVRDHATRSDFPRPVAELASGRLWLRSQVDAYAAARQRKRRSALKAS